MRTTILTAIICLGAITTAHAQTTTSTGIDPLSVPTSTIPSGSSFSASTSADVAGGSTSSTAGADVNGSVTTRGSSVGGNNGISAPASHSPQAPLELPGEGLNNSTQAASTTAAAPSTPSTICPPSIPTTDGGSANITVIDGFSPGGC